MALDNSVENTQVSSKEEQSKVTICKGKQAGREGITETWGGQLQQMGRFSSI